MPTAIHARQSLCALAGFTTFFKRTVLGLSLGLTLSACSSVTVKPLGGEKLDLPASYIDSKAFYLGGFFGRHKVDVNEVCDGAEVLQMQTIVTGSDFLIGALTLFIYAPRTVRVWCQDEQ